jgi:hypothetical protein
VVTFLDKYHEIFKNPYLYNLIDQNYKILLLDTRCYPGAKLKNDVYFGINHVIGNVTSCK